MTRFRYLLLGLITLYAGSGIASIRTEERAVVRRFGRVVARPVPGLWIGLPWGIDRIDRVSIQPRQLSFGYVSEQSFEAPGTPPGQFLTADQNLINLRLVIEYMVQTEGDQLDRYLAQQAQIDTILNRETETLAAEWVSRRAVDDVLAGRTELSLDIGMKLVSRLEPYQLGIRLQRVSVEWLAAPDEVRDAFEAVNQAQTGIRTRENQAGLEARRSRADAQITKQRLERESVAYHDRLIRPATAEADEFRKRLDQYRRLAEGKPDFLKSLWREEMGTLLDDFVARGGKLELLDPKLGPNVSMTTISPSRKR